MPDFTAGDGTRLFYTEWGEGTPVVFLAGAWLSSASWEYQMLPLSEHARCIAYDRRGHGRSDRVGHGYDYDTLADDLAALLDTLDLHGVTLVAHSMAGGEAVRYLARHGDGRIDRLVLLACTLPFPTRTGDNRDGVDPAALEAVDRLRAADRPQWMAENTQAFFATHLGNRVSSALIDWTMRQCLDCSGKASFECARLAASGDFRAELARVRVPALVVHGTADVSAPIDLCGRRTRTLLPGCEYREYEGAAHGLMFTHTARLEADLREWIGV